MKTILCIDDDVNSLLLIKEQIKLIDSNIRVLTESKGENAIDTFNDYINDISVVILDIQIPNINGYDLLLLFKKLKPEIPIVMITASNYLREYDYVIKKLGASDYFIKPLSKNTMYDIISKY